MREHYEAFGSVCAAAIANGDEIVSSGNEMTSEAGNIAVNIGYDGGYCLHFSLSIDRVPECGD